MCGGLATRRALGTAATSAGLGADRIDKRGFRMHTVAGRRLGTPEGWRAWSALVYVEA